MYISNANSKQGKPDRLMEVELSKIEAKDHPITADSFYT